jgi:hydroxymethylglutaryl-CoA lyase
MQVPAKVKIRDVAPRDGFQSWPEFVPTEQKLEIIETIRGTGVSEIEITSFVNPKAVPQMRDAAELMKKVPKGKGCIYTALVPNLKGAQLALDAGTDKICVIISATDVHNKANVRRTVAESLSALDDIFSLAGEKAIPVIGGIGVAFGCPYQGDVPPEDVLKIARAYIESGAESVSFADTTGMATPPRVTQIVESFRKQFPEIELGLHFHNNRGTAMANLYAALMAGADMFDSALGGIGGCPNVPDAAGNLPTADVVYMLEDMGVDTGIDLDAVIQAALKLEKVLGKKLPGQVMKSGPREPERAVKICGTHA